MYKEGTYGKKWHERDFKPNLELALKYLLPLAENGHAKAQHNLGAIYHEQGNNEQARFWRGKLAK